MSERDNWPEKLINKKKRELMILWDVRICSISFSISKQLSTDEAKCVYIYILMGGGCYMLTHQFEMVLVSSSQTGKCKTPNPR